ncbi:disintegrin and metalloproteinase domain-containing protein 23 isoform X2 [Hirundo rustica]|uniref:disintegrin and metalloproteinase domain-containing protein 23 isoform X2 n=1 Tax=Hirundo rustica TaxID=43150 RepID=UPI001A93AA17|nr:disintegrin and metalloproteinase domain-containing protein 23 isoform X2 [Hirundo rustica]
MREVSCTANGLLFDIYCLLVWSQLWWMRKVGDSKMFERVKRSDEASASSAQGIQRHGVEGSPQQDSSSRRGQEHPRPGVSGVQNRQGYCNCCHVHYSNLEQHIFSSQHRHFTTYCRNRMGTSSLMERFLQDVLQHHPHRYHDSRPTYDDMPLPITLEAPRISCPSSEEMQKKRNSEKQEISSKDQESISKISSSVPCLSREGTKNPFVQKLPRGQERVSGISQQSTGICSDKKWITLKNARIANHSHEGQFTAVSPIPQQFSLSPTSHSSTVYPKTGKSVRDLASSDLFLRSGCDERAMEVCSSDVLLNPRLNPTPALLHPKRPSVSHQNPTCSHSTSSFITSGQSLSKRDSLRTQDETLVSDLQLRDTVGVSSSLDLGTSPQLARCKNMKTDRGDESSVDETIEDVILKYCHETTSEEIYFKEENNPSVPFSSLLDHTNLEGSEMSFDCDAPIQVGTDLPKAAIKDIEFLKEVQVCLQDKDYGTQLSSVLKTESLEKIEAVKKDVIVHTEEPVLPALPHVPPSFVGKTWSQIMYEDDIKIEELVRDFREGRFRCYFNSESSAKCTGKRMKKKKQKDEKRINIIEGNRTEDAPVKALPEFNDALSGGSDFDNPSLASDTLCNPKIVKTPRKRTWRLASRCQVVKVSHGTQTSLLNYPVAKRKMSRRESDPADQKASVSWLENEKTPNMKTRLCALKLPESYSKIMSPVQPKTVVYVLSCPEVKQCKGKPIDIPKMRKNHHSTDSKDSVRYKYKQCSLKYYDPLTNRILKTPPKCTVGEKAKKPSHVRQLFKSLSCDANMKKLADVQRESTPSKSLNWSDFCSSSSASFLPDRDKRNDAASSQKADGPSVSTERTDCLVSENSFKHLIISPLNSVIEADYRLIPFNRITKTPLTSIRSEWLERETPKAIWKRKEGTNKEPVFPRKTAGSKSVKCTIGRRGNRVTTGKQTSRTKKQQKEGMRRQLQPCAQKSAFSIHRCQTRKTTVGKHPKKEKPDAKKLKVRRKPKRAFLNSTVVTGIPEKRQKVTSESFPKKPEQPSSKVRSWEVSGDRGHPGTVKRPSRRTSAVPLLRNCLVLPGLHWNETAGGIEEVLADEENTFQQTKSSNSKNNSYSNAIQKEITLPSRLIYYINKDSETPYHILDTRARHQQKHDKAVHLAQASFQIEAFGSKFILDLTLNNDLLSSNYVEIHYEDGKPKFSKGGEHCYYHGNIRGVKDSKVALSTCNGLHGMFEDSTYLYLIEPMDLTHTAESKSRPHIIQKTYGTQAFKQLRDLETESSSEWPFLSELQWLRRRRRKRALSRGVFEEMKYLELMIVNDHKMFKRHRSSTAYTNNFAKSVVNLVDAIYKEQLNTRVVLVAVETWTDRDRINIHPDPLQMLHDFSKYRQHYIKQHADAVHLLSNVTFHYKRSSLSYFGGVCSVARGVGVNEYGLPLPMAQELAQSLAQNLGIQWEPAARKPKCDCTESWGGCIMEETGVYHSRKFSKCSIAEYKEFLLRGGGACLFNRPTKLFEATECGNGYVEAGEECDCGFRMECYADCCKKCSLSNGAHCSDGPCCNTSCLFFPRGYDCRYAVNECDIAEFCTGDSGQCPPNLHKQDGYACDSNQGRCYNGECKTRDNQCKYIWGSKSSGSDKFCYEKLNTEGTTKGNCGKDGDKWIQCSKHDVFCGFLLCTNLTKVPRVGQVQGEIIPNSFYHQGRIVDCSGAHVLLDDDTDLGYVEDGAPCGPQMMCLDKKCLPIQSLNISSCPIGSNGKVCSGHGVCSNEATCICNFSWAGTDCSIDDPVRDTGGKKDEGPKEMSKNEGSIQLNKALSEEMPFKKLLLTLLDFGFRFQSEHNPQQKHRWYQKLQ